MNYKLINKLTGEEHICQKVTVGEWNYYVSDEKYIEDELLYCVANGWLQKARVEHLVEQRGEHNQWKKVIATNNPNIDIPKVVDEVEKLAIKHATNPGMMSYIFPDKKESFKEGYNKSQEAHPFSEEDMIEFLDWKEKNHYVFTSDGFTKIGFSKFYTTKELLQLWKSKQLKTLYYE